VKVIEFHIRDIKKMMRVFDDKSGTIFIPASQIDYDKSYSDLPENNSENSSFLADLKFEESQAFLKLERYDEALTSVEEAQKQGFDSHKKGIHFLIGRCLEKLGRYKEAIQELKKAEKEDPKVAEINYILGECYRNLCQIDFYLKEVETTLRKKKEV